MADVSPVEAREQAALVAWPAEEAHPIGRWTLRASGGFTRRANSVAAIGALPADPDRAIAAAEAFYRARRLPPIFQVADVPSTVGLREELARRGYGADAPTIFQIAPLAAVIAATPPPPAHLTIDTAPPEDWFRLWWEVDGRGPGSEPSAHRLLARIPSPKGFATLRSATGVLAVALGVVNGPDVGLFCAAVAPVARGRRHGPMVSGALARWARSHGAVTAYSQVMEANTSSRAMSRRLGFAADHTYRYWSPSGSSSGRPT